MTYNLTNISSAQGLSDYLVAVNNLTNNLFGISVLFALFVIIMFSFMKFGTREALIGASFITGLSGIMFAVIGLITGEWVTIILVLMGLVMAISYVNR